MSSAIGGDHSDEGLAVLVGLSGLSVEEPIFVPKGASYSWGVGGRPPLTNCVQQGTNLVRTGGTLDDVRSRVSDGLSGIVGALKASPIFAGVGLACLAGALVAATYPGRRRAH